jgi:hypothetical protein
LAERPYRNLERPVLRRFAQEDPSVFLLEQLEGALIEAMQRVMALLSCLHDTWEEQQAPDSEAVFRRWRDRGGLAAARRARPSG